MEKNTCLNQNTINDYTFICPICNNITQKASNNWVIDKFIDKSYWICFDCITHRKEDVISWVRKQRHKK